MECPHKGTHSLTMEINMDLYRLSELRVHDASNDNTTPKDITPNDITAKVKTDDGLLLADIKCGQMTIKHGINDGLTFNLSVDDDIVEITHGILYARERLHLVVIKGTQYLCDYSQQSPASETIRCYDLALNPLGYLNINRYAPLTIYCIDGIDGGISINYEKISKEIADIGDSMTWLCEHVSAFKLTQN